MSSNVQPAVELVLLLKTPLACLKKPMMGGERPVKVAGSAKMYPELEEWSAKVERNMFALESHQFVLERLENTFFGAINSIRGDSPCIIPPA